MHDEFRTLIKKLTTVCNALYGSHAYQVGYLGSLCTVMFDKLNRANQVRIMNMVLEQCQKHEQELMLKILLDKNTDSK